MKNQVLNFILIGLVSNVFFAETTLAQISRKGTPPSEKYSNLKKINNLPIIIMGKFDIDKFIEKDKIEEDKINKPFRFAKAFDVNINVKKEGLLEILPMLNIYSTVPPSIFKWKWLELYFSRLRHPTCRVIVTLQAGDYQQ